MLGRIFCRQHSAKGEAATIVCIVCDGYLVGLAVPRDGVYARHLSAADAVEAKFVGRHFVRSFFRAIGLYELSHLPSAQAVHFGNQFFGQRDASAAGMIEFMYVMSLLELRRVILKTIHYPSQVAVQCPENGDTQTEVAAPEKRFSTFRAETLHLVFVLSHPACAATDYLHIMLKRPHAVVERHMRSRKLDSHIGRAERLAVEILLVVHINDAHNLVTTTPSYLLYHVAHFAVSNERKFHFSFIFRCKSNAFNAEFPTFASKFLKITRESMEKLLHYVWKHKILPLKALLTTDGREVEIIDPGLQNNDQGPDFFNAKVRIGETVWVGNVEIHLKSRDWYRHGHHTDPSYNNTILHVAQVVDCDVETESGTHPPQLQLDIPAQLAVHYEELNKTDDYPRCHRVIPQLERMKIHSWMDALLVERLAERSENVVERVKKTNGNWEEATWITLCRNFGFGLNGDAFERWARLIPLQAVGKHRDNLLQIESIFLGEAGLLDEMDDSDCQKMKNEFAFLCHKFNLPAPMTPQDWKYLRTRPQNFPHVRIRQIARLFHSGHTQMRSLVETTDVKMLQKALADGGISKASCQLIIINTVVPLLYAYGQCRKEQALMDRALAFLAQLPAEDNYIIRQWKSCGLDVTSAADSQALIQLKREYCDRKDCLRCRIGYEYLKRL